MSFRIERCRAGQCRAMILWETTDRGGRIALDHRPIKLEQALADSKLVYWIDERGRALAWSPMMVVDVGDLYRAHSMTCVAPREAVEAPEVAPVPARLVEPPEPDPQLRMPVLPRRFTRRPDGAGHTHHERGNDVHHRRTGALG